MIDRHDAVCKDSYDRVIVPVARFAVEKTRVVALAGLKEAHFVHQLNLALGTAINLQRQANLRADPVFRAALLAHDNLQHEMSIIKGNCANHS